jgi:GNAT superfamily N-acetyltransferase
MIRPAKQDEFKKLTNISFKSKGYWKYPKEYFDIWEKELTVNSGYIKDNEVFVLEEARTIIGYYSIVELKDDVEMFGITINNGHWLDHMFILPEFIGKGMGKKMFKHLLKRCETKRIKELCILADPNSRLFYEKMGCKYQREYPSTIKNRTTPFLKYELTDC